MKYYVEFIAFEKTKRSSKSFIFFKNITLHLHYVNVILKAHKKKQLSPKNIHQLKINLEKSF